MKLRPGSAAGAQGGAGHRAAAQRAPLSAIERGQRRAAWLFVAPALILIGVFFFVPVLGGLLLSLTDFDIYAVADPSTTRFVGLGNYAWLLESKEFWNALQNTGVFVLLSLPLSIAVSLLAALGVNSKLARWKPFFRTAYFAPVVTTLVAVAVVWRYLYHPRYGWLNYALGAFGIEQIDWLGDAFWAKPAIVLLTIWKNFGYNMLILIAGLQTIPDDLYEAAELDGAGPFRRFWHVTLPGLRPTLLFVGVMTMIASFQIFAEPYVMTQGGPFRSTVTILLLMYEEGFRWWRLGLASAIAVVLLLVMLLGMLAQFRPPRRRA